MLEDLRDSIIRIRAKHKNIYSQYFIPNQDVYDILTEEAIRNTFLDCDTLLSSHKDAKYRLENYEIEQAVDAVMKGAHRVFAILIFIRSPGLIRQFIKHDNYQILPRDHGLPFDLEKLEIILGENTIAMEFYDAQWQFTAPVFSDDIFTRELPPETVLPFVKESSIADGAFGDVFAIEIAPSSQLFNSDSGRQQKLVRKEFRSRHNTKAEYESELRVLSNLKLLRHPNIVNLLSAYIYQGRHNLIFPRATGGTLSQLFSTEGPRPQSFKSNESILIALSGLCSAVHAVHQFVSPENRLELIGCHHDLKPDNIFVEGSKFLLADFGLARFKNITSLSDTPSRTKHPYYSPPECWISENDIESPVIHRSSDIWSLGCIIAEVVTYMLYGAKGVENFESERTFKKGRATSFRFHREGRAEPGVTKWINKLRQSDEQTHRMLGQLVGEMLQTQQELRPKAREVEAKMQLITVDIVCQRINELYEGVCMRSRSIIPFLERTRFDSWRHACRILEFDRSNPLRNWKEISDCPPVYETLGQIRVQLEGISCDCENPRSRSFEPLLQLNDQLIKSLPDKDQRQASVYLETRIMSGLSDSDTVELAKIGEKAPGLARRMSAMASVKCMAEMLQNRPTHFRCIDRSRLRSIKHLRDYDPHHGDYKLQHLKCKDGRKETPVVVESRTFQEDPQGDRQIAMELQERLEAITGILIEANNAEEQDRFRVLPCAGFYQDLQTFSCGLVYEFPRSSKEQQFFTLRSALDEKLESQPPLEQRFELAQALTISVLNFHTVSWLQKAISSYNIVFFHPTDESWLTGMKSPYFLGFLYSRSNDGEAFTSGPPDNLSHRNYQHPEYLGDKLRYRAEYDYYSLGLVLLEIGLWKPLEKILKALREQSKSMDISDNTSSPKALIDRIIGSCVSRLRLTMGTRYEGIVKTCLRGTFEVTEGLDQRNHHLQLQRSFSSLVVEQLAECKL